MRRGAGYLTAVSITGTLILVSACASPSTQGGPITSWRGEPLTTEQLPLAADGMVTKAELHQAYEDAVRCVEDQGWTSSLSETIRGAYVLQAQAEAGESIEVAAAVLESCQQQFVGNLASIYESDNIPTGEERETEFKNWQECMMASGGSVEGIRLGDPQAEVITRLEELSGLDPTNWSPEWNVCIEKYYLVLWPESFSG